MVGYDTAELNKHRRDPPCGQLKTTAVPYVTLDTAPP